MNGVNRRSPYFILEGHKPVQVENIYQWAAWFEDEKNFYLRRVGLTNVWPGHVSTVLLGMDPNFTTRGEPLLFETLIFRGPADGEMRRTTTWEAALNDHKVMVARALKARRSPAAWLRYLLQ